MEISIFLYFIIVSLKAVLINMFKMEVKIVQGDLAPLDEFPHSVYLLIISTPQAHSCGSSILNQAFLLTAAHCVKDCKIGDTIYAFLGKQKKYTGLKIAVKNYKKHPQFAVKEFRNDVAIAMLARPIKLGDTMSRVAIMKNPPDDKVAYVAGWGRTDEVNNITGIYLKYAKQVLWDRQKCSRVLRRIIPGTVFCAGADRNDYGYAASGDSGSALVIRGYIQIGIVSYKVPKLSKDVIVYTATSRYLKWIRKQIYIFNCETN